MKIKTLIKKLEKYNPNTDVFLQIKKTKSGYALHSLDIIENIETKENGTICLLSSKTNNK